PAGRARAAAPPTPHTLNRKRDLSHLRGPEPVRLRDERLDLALALDQQRQRRGLDATERDDAADPRTPSDGRRAGGVHADEPVGLGARARRGLERRKLLTRPEVLEALLDRRLRQGADPEA